MAKLCWLMAAMAACASPPPIVLAGRPATATVAVPENARRQETLVLQIGEVRIPKNTPILWNIFWNLPAANSRTPTSHANFAGYIASPANSFDSPRPVGFTLQLPERAAASARRVPTMMFTFVPMGQAASTPIVIGSIRIE